MITRIVLVVLICGSLALAQTGRRESQGVMLPLHQYLLSVAYARDGTHIAYGGTDPRIVIAELSSGRKNILQGHQNTVVALSFSPDGAILASASEDGTVKLWNWRSGVLIRSFDTSTPASAVFALSFSPDGKKIADVSSDSTLSVWDVASGSLSFRRQFDLRLLSRVLFASDGKRLFVAGETANNSGQIEIWDLDTQTMKAQKRFNSYITALALSIDHKLFVGTSNGEVSLYDVNRDQIEKSWKAHEAPIREIKLSSNGLLATVISWKTPDLTIWFINGTPKVIHSFTNDEDGATSIDFSPDNREIAVAGRDNKIRFWNVVNGQLLRIMDPNVP